MTKLVEGKGLEASVRLLTSEVLQVVGVREEEEEV